MASLAAGGAKDSFLKALTHVTGEIVQYATLVRANILEVDVKASGEKYREFAVDKFFYLCFGRHALFFVDRSMKGKNDGDGTLKRIPYVAINQLRTDPEESCLLCIDFKGEDAGRPQDVPPKVYLHVMSREEVLTQLQVSWKTDYIMQKYEIKGFPDVVRDSGLNDEWNKHWDVRCCRLLAFGCRECSLILVHHDARLTTHSQPTPRAAAHRASRRGTKSYLALGQIREPTLPSSPRRWTTSGGRSGPTPSSLLKSTKRQSSTASWRWATGSQPRATRRAVAAVALGGGWLDGRKRERERERERERGRERKREIEGEEERERER